MNPIKSIVGTAGDLWVCRAYFRRHYNPRKASWMRLSRALEGAGYRFQLHAGGWQATPRPSAMKGA